MTRSDSLKRIAKKLVVLHENGLIDSKNKSDMRDLSELFKFAPFYKVSNYHSQAHYISKECKINNDSIKNFNKIHKTEKFRLEHIVPRSVLVKLFLSLPEKNEKVVYDFLEKFAISAIITINEDNLLNTSNLKSTMPDEFYDENHNLYLDPFARYKKVGIFNNLELMNLTN
jgi:hypothetical protein